jgi:4-amino-4-deoxy-L-arabinose transferase-like glycosyltransferase
VLPAWLLRVWRSPWPWMALVVLLFCAPLWMALDRHDFDNDEAIYSFSVDRMLKTGDWLTPRMIPSETYPFLEKPPLKFWIVGLPIRWGLLPANEFGMRFWDVLMGSAAFLYVFAIGRRLAGPLCGFAAVYLLFAHGSLVLEHGLRTNNMEAAVFLTYAAGMYHFLAWRSSGPDARGHVIAIALFFVLGFMTKFVAAAFMPLILVLAALLTHDDRVRVYFQRWSFVIAAAIALVLIAPWFLYQYWVFGPRLFDTMFGDHVLKRFTAYLDPAHLQPWHFYFTHLWSQLRGEGVAWLVSLGAALIAWRTLRRRWVEGALLILWFALPMVLISAGTSKLYHYAYPFLPPVALAGGYAIARLSGWAWSGLPSKARMLAIPVAAVLLMLPASAYLRVVAEIKRDARPLQTLRACLAPIETSWVAEGKGEPGVWVEGQGFTHRYAYYLYGLGPWQQRDIASDATVAMHLFTPNDYRPVLLAAHRYDDFIEHLRRDPDEVIRAAARHTDVPPEVLLNIFHGTAVGLVPLESATLLLPGPYSGCAKEQFTTASR